MSDYKEKYNDIIVVLKSWAEKKHCYDKNSNYTTSSGNSDDIFNDGIDYGEITFARTMLECLGETFEYPSMKEVQDNDA